MWRKSAIPFVVWLLLAVGSAAYLWAGAPKACDDKEHPGVAPCNMKSCQHMDKNGKPNGSRCSHYCTHKGVCCRCAQNCASDPAYNPDEEGQGIESGRVD